jgi:hypothetical protein
MKRRILAVVLGLLAWVVVASICDRLLRLAWPAYADGLPTFSFSLAMLLARQVEGAASTCAAGFVTAKVAKGHRATVVVTGVLLLLFFLPTHAMIWAKFPVWYHLLFLASLVPLTILGGRAASRRG